MVAYVIAVVPIVWVSRSIIIFRILLSNFIFLFRNKLILMGLTPIASYHPLVLPTGTDPYSFIPPLSIAQWY